MTARIETPIAVVLPAISSGYFNNATGAYLQNAGLAYQVAQYGGGSPQTGLRVAAPRWIGLQPAAIAFTIPPEPPPP